PYHTEELFVEGISKDTREIGNNELFFIIEGKHFDIFSFIGSLEDKVVAFVAEKKKKSLVESIVKKKPVIFVDDIEKEFKRAVDIFYNVDTKNLKFIGVTGTNGKTTTTYLLHHILTGWGIKCGLIGTVGYILGDERIEASLTTPDYVTLRKLFYKMCKSSISYVIMEVSSHSIEQKRIENIPFSYCIFTNLSRDHLDYHKTMKNYFTVKKSFFLSNPLATSLINIDDRFGRIIFSEFKGEKYSYGVGNKRSDYRGFDFKLSSQGLEFTIEKLATGKQTKIYSHLLGRHNILNILAVFSCIDCLGLDWEESLRFLYSFRGVDGRLERVKENIFIDYAHTPDALKNVLLTLRECGYNSIVLVFGCGGNRDKGKRKIMGKIASKLADFTIVTSDNPRDENPLDICEDIRRGFLYDNYSIVLDREEAIRDAIKLKDSYCNCALLVAGKGHEDYQIFKDKKIPFKDKFVIDKILNE
ncbi:MAG: UDP-N-acetylmuramoyl-L-alanyl-D-glutamate--2,6-diaminopimelate ligase, partial [Candidatus Omnitrophica bacterium]|nr:UDP-N-acetylmuramoyl-L-alanyl-D-glutamate--2,6-diaminopimelate ligase [Candidatus Omnitrophota bacterium]